jgi:hypothetical protein
MNSDCERREAVGEKITVQIDAALVQKMRDKAIADGLPNASVIPDEELLSALIQDQVGEEPGPVVITPASGTVWVTAEDGLNLRVQPKTGTVVKVLAYQDELTLVGQQEGWFQVRTSDGRTGWVSADYVSDEEPPPAIPPKGNVRGIHGSAGTIAPPVPRWDFWISELEAMGTAWYKQLDNGDPNDVHDGSVFAWARKLKRNGIEPIIRYYQGAMFPSRLPNQAFQKMKRYADEVGIVWCEIGNEPNLDYEWHSDHSANLSWQDAYYPKTIVEDWINDAEKVVAAGARPGFYALAPTDWNGGVNEKNSSVMFYRRMFEHVAANPNLLHRFRRLFEPGKAWLAVHVSTYEFEVDFNPFPPGQPPHDMCLRGYEIPLRYMREILGITNVIVMSTEGGVFCKDSTSMTNHRRLQSHEEHAQRTVEMFAWLQHHSPLQAMCPWLISNVQGTIGHHDSDWMHDGWYDDGGPKPVVRAMKDTKPI